MPAPISRFFGITLLLTGLTGILLAGYGIYNVWRLKGPITASAKADLNLTITALDAINEGLTVAEGSLDAAANNIDTLESTLVAVATGIEQTPELLDAVSTLIANDLPTTIEATQTSLDAARSSAEILENVLVVITSIPFIPGEPYAPEVPLYVALGEVSTSLEEIPASLSKMDDSLGSTRENLIEVEFELLSMADTVGQITMVVDDTQEVIDRYQTTIQALSRRMKAIEARLESWFNILAWSLTVLLVWIGLTQVGLILQGSALLQTAGLREDIGAG